MLELSFALATGGNLEDLNLEDGKYIRMPYAKVGPEDVDEYLNRYRFWRTENEWEQGFEDNH